MCFLDTEKHCRFSSFKFLNWNKIALHCCAVFHRTTQISQNYIGLCACSGASVTSNSLGPCGSLPGSSVHDILQARILKWIAMGLFQHHSSKTSILQHSASFIVQISDPYMTTGKTITLSRWTCVGKLMSLFLICCLGWS